MVKTPCVNRKAMPRSATESLAKVQFEVRLKVLRVASSLNTAWDVGRPQSPTVVGLVRYGSRVGVAVGVSVGVAVGTVGDGESVPVGVAVGAMGVAVGEQTPVFLSWIFPRLPTPSSWV